MAFRISLMRNTNRKAPATTLAFALAVCFSGSLLAQTTAPISFNGSESALKGTVSCNGGPPTAISSVEMSETDVSGSNEVQGSNLSGSACGLPLYSFGSTDDKTSASDTSSLDDSEGTSSITNACLLGGVVCFGTKSETDSCAADASGNVSCHGTSIGNNLYFAGKHITGTFTQPTTFHTTNLQVSIGGACTGIALFNGDLTLASSSTTTIGNQSVAIIAPVTLNGTLSCIGLPLTTETVALQDIEYVIWDDSFSDLHREAAGVHPLAVRPVVDDVW